MAGSEGGGGGGGGGSAGGGARRAAAPAGAAAASPRAGGEHSGLAAPQASPQLHRRPQVSPALEAQMRREDEAWRSAAASAGTGAGGSAWRSMQEARARLPVAAYAAAVVELVAKNQVILLR